MSNRGKNNGSYSYDCPFCHERKGKSNLEGFTPAPEGFPDVSPITKHTVACWRSLWIVEEQETDKESVFYGQWSRCPLSLCVPGLLCDECKENNGHMQDCDHFHHEAPYEIAVQVYNDKKEQNEYPVRMRRV